MAKRFPVASVVAAAVAFSCFLTFAYAANDYLFVEGKVYCDPCRVMFETKLSKNIPGAKVRLECRDRVDYHTTYSLETTTDKDGKYNLAVEGDHEDEICELDMVHSPDPECNQPMPDIPGDRLALTTNLGVSQPIRFANPLGFMTKEASPECPQALKDMGLESLDD